MGSGYSVLQIGLEYRFEHQNGSSLRYPFADSGDG